jgi:hypothetical protein
MAFSLTASATLPQLFETRREEFPHYGTPPDGVKMGSARHAAVQTGAWAQAAEHCVAEGQVPHLTAGPAGDC